MTEHTNMTSNRPYLLKAFYQWIVDNEFTPYIVVEADLPHVSVPPQTVKEGQVVLNISSGAVQSLLINNDQITFSARFGGVPFEVYIPMYAISAIYARENGAGTMFPPEDIPEDVLVDNNSISAVETPETELSENSQNMKTKTEAKDKKTSHLTVVK